MITVAAAVALHRPVRPRFVLFLAGFALLVVVRGALEIGRFLQSRRTADGQGVTRLGVALVGIMAVLSLASLRVNYRYPKQDFVGAMNFVESRKGSDDPVLTAGPATYPYEAYFHKPWRGIKTQADLDAARAAGKPVWVLYTLASYIAHDAPDLMKTLQTECTVREVFRGTVGGGDVTVCSLPSR